METPELDTNRPVTTYRTMTGAKYSQDGHLFSLAHVYIGADPNHVVDEPEDEEVIELPVDNDKAGVLARATEKLSAYSEPEDLAETTKENARAANAERLAV